MSHGGFPFHPLEILQHCRVCRFAACLEARNRQNGARLFNTPRNRHRIQIFIEFVKQKLHTKYLYLLEYQTGEAFRLTSTISSMDNHFQGTKELYVPRALLMD